MEPLRFICAPSFSVMPGLDGGDVLAILGRPQPASGRSAGHIVQARWILLEGERHDRRGCIMAVGHHRAVGAIFCARR